MAKLPNSTPPSGPAPNTPAAALRRPMPPAVALRTAAAAGLALVALVITLNAWLCDDAYIVLRVVDNFVSGRGLRWNAAERVQVFTCPLWTLLLAVPYALTREAYYTTLISCVALSIATATLILTRAARTPWAVVFAAAAMATSKAFVDFSTSGLENPLSHLLLAALFILALRPDPDATPTRRTLVVSLIASLLVLNRLDLALIAAPILACRALRSPRPRPVVAAAIGQFPLAAWLLFSLIYYGFFLPNTAYAKLNTDVAASHLIERGLYYLQASFAADPVSLTVTALGVAAGLLAALRTRTPAPAAAAVGIVLYLVYAVRIGGDFMSGRFVAAPFVAGLTLLLLTTSENPWLHRAGVVAAAAVGLTWTNGPLHIPTGADRAAIFREVHRHRGIGDERTYYAQTLALAWLFYGFTPPDHQRFHDARAFARARPDSLDGPDVMTGYAVGIHGFVLRDSHIVDGYALADPLLARIRPYFRNSFRPGHLTRMIPPGYLETLATGRNQIEDPDLARYYDRLALITRGPLFSRERWRAILDMQLGRLDHLVRHDRFREPARNRWPEDLPLPWFDGRGLIPPGTRPVQASP